MKEKVKYVGEDKNMIVWIDHMHDRKIKVNKGDIFKIGKWDRIDSVLTDKNEWIYDIDSQCFKDDFEKC